MEHILASTPSTRQRAGGGNDGDGKQEGAMDTFEYIQKPLNRDMEYPAEVTAQHERMTITRWQHINALGAEGWELCAIVPVANQATWEVGTGWFKRRVSS